MSAMLGVAMLMGSLSPVMVGEVTYYGPGVMERVYENRLRWGHVEACPECIGMVALLEREHVGKRVFLQRAGEKREGPFLVVDCAARKDLRRLKERGLVAEVDWRTARRWGMRGPVEGVRVMFEDAVFWRQEGVKKGDGNGH
jgi:hypothetical protein